MRTRPKPRINVYLIALVRTFIRDPFERCLRSCDLSGSN
jgi:hypothetical protein